MDRLRLPFVVWTLSLWLSLFGGSLGTLPCPRSRIRRRRECASVSDGEAELLATRTGAAPLRALDGREEEVRATAGSDGPMAEAVEELSERSWDGSLSARAQVIDRSKALLDEDRAELEALTPVTRQGPDRLVGCASASAR